MRDTSETNCFRSEVNYWTCIGLKNSFYCSIPVPMYSSAPQLYVSLSFLVYLWPYCRSCHNHMSHTPEISATQDI